MIIINGNRHQVSRPCCFAGPHHTAVVVIVIAVIVIDVVIVIVIVTIANVIVIMVLVIVVIFFVTVLTVRIVPIVFIAQSSRLELLCGRAAPCSRSCRTAEQRPLARCCSDQWPNLFTSFFAFARRDQPRRSPKLSGRHQARPRGRRQSPRPP